MKYILYILVFALSFSCISNKKRAERKIRKAKMLAPELFVENEVIHDTVIVDRITYDTITDIQYHDSTIVINNDRVYLKYYYDTLRQEIHHKVICKETINPVEYRFTKENTRGLTVWENIGEQKLVIGGFVFLLLLILILTRRKK